MRKMEETRSILVRHKEEFERRYGVTIVGLFGSYTRGEQTPASDLDVLVEVRKPIGLDFFELWDELERLLGAKIDLLTVKSSETETATLGEYNGGYGICLREIG